MGGCVGTHSILNAQSSSLEIAQLKVLRIPQLLSEALPATSFLESLAESLAAVEAAHVRPSPPSLRPRPDDIIRSSMRGDAAALVLSFWFEQDDRQRVVRVFLSSTFTDTVHERAVLLRCVHPVVQRYARKINFEVILSEMRFGIRKSLSDDNKTSEVCMTELERCANESASLSYMLFVRNKYGFRPPPRRVPEVDMRAMLELMPPADRDTVQEFYEIDENVLITPQECYRISANMHGAANVVAAAYVLRNSGHVTDFWPRFSQLQNALRNAASLHWPSALNELEDYRSQHPIRFFFFSVTEEEICRGLFWKEAADIERSAHVFLRPIEAAGGGGISSLDSSSKELANFVDLADKKIDGSAQVRLTCLRQMIDQATSQASNIVTKGSTVVEWLDGTGFQPSHAPHAIDLQQFAYASTVRLLETLDRANESLAFQPHPQMAEILHHMKFAHARSSKFAHSEKTKQVTSKLRDYLCSSVGFGHAFVIYGASGSGKTYLMAEAADRQAHSLSSPADVVIVRFLGTSPSSSNLADLLHSLCRQLHDAHPAAHTPERAAVLLPSGDEVEKLKEYFELAMKTWPAGRLTLFLDSLDQLDDTFGGRKLSWLPTHGLSPNVRMVVSTLPDESAPADGKPFACLSILQKRYSGSSSVSATAEVQPVEDVRSLLLHLLKFHKHKLSDTQLRVLEAAIKLSPSTQTPLVVTILAVRFSEWPSHRDLPPDNRNPDGSLFIDTSSVRALIIQEFKALEAKHGTELVRAALSFITLANDGVSETELSEMLSLDDDVLASVYEWWVPPVRTLPTNPLTMLLSDLKPYLTMRGSAIGGGGLMMRWYHRQFWEAADDFFLRDTEERRRRHAQLGEFFTGAWAHRSKPYNERLKAAVQKKVAGEVSGDRRVRPQPLCLREGKNIFETKGDPGAVNERRCREASHHLLAAGMFKQAAEEMCDFEGICARARCGEGFKLLLQLTQLRERVGLFDLLKTKQQLKLEHFERWLRRDMSTIVADPGVETITSCSRQPEVSLAREDLNVFWQRTSAGIRFDRGDTDYFFRSFVLGPVNRHFDSCFLSLTHHKGSVRSLAFNGSLLASASNDKTIAICDMHTGVTQVVLKGHTDEIQSVAWSPDGKFLASGSYDHTVRLWDVRTEQEMAQLQHTSAVVLVAFDGSGQFVASVSEAKLGIAVRLWDFRTKQEVFLFDFEVSILRAERQTALVFRDSGNCLVGVGFKSGFSHIVRVLDVRTKKEVAAFKPTEEVSSVALDKSGNYVAAGCYGTLRVWDIRSKREVALLKHTGLVSSIAFDSSGSYLASQSTDSQPWFTRVHLWNLREEQEVSVLSDIDKTCSYQSIVFNDSGKYVASVFNDCTVRVNHVSSEHGVTELKGHAGEVKSVALDASGTLLASGAWSDTTVRLWDLRKKKEVAVLKGHKLAWKSKKRVFKERADGWVHSVALDLSGNYCAAGISGGQHTVSLWDVGTRQEVVFDNHSDYVKSLAFNGSGQYLASGSEDGTVCLWDVISKKEVAVLQHASKVHSVAFDGSGKCLASGCECEVFLWDVATKKQRAVLKIAECSDVWSVAFDGSGNYVAAGIHNEAVCMWDVRTKKEVAVLKHSSGVQAIAFDSSGNYLASVCDGVHVWDIRTKKEVTVIGRSAGIVSVAFDKRGTYCATGCFDHSVRLWDLSA